MHFINFLVWGLTIWVPLLPYIFPSWFQSFLLIFTLEIPSPIWIEGVGLGRKSHLTRLRKQLQQQILVDHTKRRYIHWYKICFLFVYLASLFIWLVNEIVRLTTAAFPWVSLQICLHNQMNLWTADINIIKNIRKIDRRIQNSFCFFWKGTLFPNLLLTIVVSWPLQICWMKRLRIDLTLAPCTWLCHAVSAPFESDEFLQLIHVLIFFFMRTG